MLFALLFLAGGSAAATIYAAAALYAIAWKPWPASVAELRIRWTGYLGLAAMGLCFVAMTSYGFVLGRRAWKLSAGVFDASAEGGQDSDPPSAAVVTTTTAVATPGASQ